MPRQMPKKGFYVRPPTVGTDINGKSFRSGGDITYTTGVRGGGGHRYIRFDIDSNKSVPKNVKNWFTLLWTCVPGKKELLDLVYAKTLEEAVSVYNSGLVLRYIDYCKYKFENLGPNPDPIKIV